MDEAEFPIVSSINGPEQQERSHRYQKDTRIAESCGKTVLPVGRGVLLNYQMYLRQVIDCLNVEYHLKAIGSRLEEFLAQDRRNYERVCSMMLDENKQKDLAIQDVEEDFLDEGRCSDEIRHIV